MSSRIRPAAEAAADATAGPMGDAIPGDPSRAMAPSAGTSTAPGPPPLPGGWGAGAAPARTGGEAALIEEEIEEPRGSGPDEPPAIQAESFRVSESPRAEVDLTCDVCGAPLAWSPEEGALHCQHCNATHTVDVAPGTIIERPLGAAQSAARGFGRAVRILACETCDAHVSFEGASTSEACPFCGSANVLAQEANRNQIRPESLIPLEVGKAGVEAAFKRWVTGLWFRPSALKAQRTFEAVGVYVPAWTFDAHLDSSWSAQSGTYYWVTQHYTATVNGRRVRRTRRVRKTRWRPAWGERSDDYDDVLVLASKGLDQRLAGKLGGFSFAGLVPYSPAYLAGWRAEEYRVDLAEGWDGGRAQMEASQRRRCAGDVPGDTHRALRVKNRISDVRWKHVLLPIWSMTYTFRGKPYAVLVHGQSGKIVGRAPYSWVKILLFILGLVAVGLAIAALASVK